MMKPTRSLLPHEIPVMLHRSPSGAKRKIRQRREENGSRPSPFLSPSSSSSIASSSVTSSPTPDDGNYRSLIDSGGYQSILPDFEPAYTPQPPPRLNSFISTSMISLDVNTTVSSPVHSKPTVEVHPMPADERSQSREDIAIKKEKPAVPAKPKGLRIDHMNRSTSLSSLASPIQHTTSTFLNNLVNSPSLVSLQNAYKNPDLGSQEFRKLEDKRLESISEVSRRISTFENEKDDLEGEFESNERLGGRILDVVNRQNTVLCTKIRRHLENNVELLRLETKLLCQLEKVTEHLKKAGGEQNDAIIEEARLRRRLNDAKVLRTSYDRRQQDLEYALSTILSENEYRMWEKYSHTLTQLIKEGKYVDDCISNSKVHLRALETTRQPN